MMTRRLAFALFWSVVLACASASAQYDWQAARDRVRARLVDDVARFAPPRASPADAVKQALETPDKAVWIFRGRVFVHRSFLGDDESKATNHLKFMSSILEHHDASKRVRNFVYLFQERASGPTERDCAPDAALPVLGIAKKDGPDQCGVMIPNPYFRHVYPDWRRSTKELLEAGVKIPWERKDSRLFWRGHITGEGRVDCANLAGSFARQRAVELTRADPERFDVRYTGRCDVQRAPTRAEDACAAAFGRGAHEYPLRCRVPRGAYSDWADASASPYARHKFLLDLPGSTTGSYSRNLNHLWHNSAVVVLWRGPLFAEAGGALQWYSPALEENRTHITVDAETARKALSRVKHDAAWREDLVRNARGVANWFLCARCLADYVVDALAELKRTLPDLDRTLNPGHHRWGPPPPNDTFAELLRAHRCDRRFRKDLVEVRAKRRGGGHRSLGSGQAACDALASLAARER